MIHGWTMRTQNLVYLKDDVSGLMMMELCVKVKMARVTAGRSSQEMGEHATPCKLLDSPPNLKMSSLV